MQHSERVCVSARVCVRVCRKTRGFTTCSSVILFIDTLGTHGWLLTPKKKKKKKKKAVILKDSRQK